METAIKSETVDSKQAAAYLGFALATLEIWRFQNKGPAYLKIGRSVRYRIADLDEWLQQQKRVVPGKEKGEKNGL
jgi:predicted DNA-binding transcriptional regulator AlpA